MNYSQFWIVGLVWFIIGFLLGSFKMYFDFTRDDEMADKISDLRELRYEAERTETLIAVTEMIGRVNRQLLIELFDEIIKTAELNEPKDEETNPTN